VAAPAPGAVREFDAASSIRQMLRGSGSVGAGATWRNVVYKNTGIA